MTVTVTPVTAKNLCQGTHKILTLPYTPQPANKPTHPTQLPERVDSLWTLLTNKVRCFILFMTFYAINSTIIIWLERESQDMFFRKSRNKKDSNAKNSSGYSRVINADNIYYSDTQKSPKNSRVATDYEESYCYAVKNVLSQKGFEAVTVQMSSDRCGISITGEYQDSTFYMFFKCHSSSLDVKEVRFSIMDIVRNIETGSYEEDKIQYILRYTFENLGFKNLDLDSKDKISHVIAYKNKTMYSFTFSCPFWIKKKAHQNHLTLMAIPLKNLHQTILMPVPNPLSTRWTVISLRNYVLLY